MSKFINRLVKCGYSYIEACSACKDILRNLPIWDLEFFVSSVERHHRCG